MNRRPTWFLSAAYLGFAVPAVVLAQAKPSPVFRITGIVVNSRDSSPVRRCVLTASLVNAGRGVGREPVVTTTDESGHFAMEVTSAGNWELSARAHNIRSQPLDVHEGYFTGIILTTQSPTYDVVFHAIPDAVLTGTIVDEAGEAVRNAQVTLYSTDADASQDGHSVMQQRGSAQTDDRGRYEVAGLEPGNYLVQVQAQPWYANSVAARPVAAISGPADPSLDMAYPVMWYPGVPDASAAELIKIRSGDTLQADFHLSAESAAHLVIPGLASGAPPQNGRNGLPGILGGGPPPTISLVLPDGSLRQVFGQFSRTSIGDLDISGLAPGNYQVSFPGGGPDTPGRMTTVHVGAGSSTSVNAAPPQSSVSVEVDGGAVTDASQIVLMDRATGQSFWSASRGGGDGRMLGPRSQRSSRPDAPGGSQSGGRGRLGGVQLRGREHISDDGGEANFQVPPGSYEVTVQANSSTFVTGLTASKGALVNGRTVTIPEGTAHLTVHLASGLATVNGFASFEGKTSVSAMVLLVPATLGDPASLTIVRRDQTNSDGSFHLDAVIPGQYILVAIDHGWSVRWTDASTLEPYLMKGIPLELRSSAVLNPKIVSVAP